MMNIHDPIKQIRFLSQALLNNKKPLSFLKHYTTSDAVVKVQLYVIDSGVVFDQLFICYDDTKVVNYIDSKDEKGVENQNLTSRNVFSDLISDQLHIHCDGAIEPLVLSDVAGQKLMVRDILLEPSSKDLILNTSAVIKENYFLTILNKAGNTQVVKNLS